MFTRLLLAAASQAAWAPVAVEAPGAGVQVPSRRTVVLMAVEHDRTVATALRGQLTGIGVELDTVTPAGANHDLEAQIRTAQDLARQPGALAVVWVSSAGGDDVVILYLHDADTGASFEREISWSGSRAASAEAVALAARRAIASLMHGHPAGMRPLAFETAPAPQPPAPAPEPQPQPPPRKRHRARLHAAYFGTNLAPRVPWQNGVLARAGWESPVGVYLSAGYVVVLPVAVANDAADLALRRHPIEAAVGFRYAPERVGVQAELAGIVDIVTTRTRPKQSQLTATDTRIVDPGVGLRARIDYAPLPWLSLPVGVGVDVFAASAPFVTVAPERDVLVEPRKVRFRLDAGVAFRF